jgi:type II secretory pathway predicted ATPase ExeA
MRLADQLPPMAIGLKFTAEKLGIGSRELARATGMSLGSVSKYLNTGLLPRKLDTQATHEAVRKLCDAKGASARQMARLFKPFIQKQDFFAGAQWRAAKEIEADARTPAPTYPPIHNHVEKEDEAMLLQKQTLTQAARQHFELFTNPFDGEVTSLDEMFTNKEFGYIREACWQAASHQRLVAIIGESGAGKTTLLGDLEERIATERKTINVIKPSVLGMEDTPEKGKPVRVAGIMDSIIYTLDSLAIPKRTMEAKTRQLQRMLEDGMKAGQQHLLVIEEAHALPVSTLKHLKRLHELRMGRRPLLGILLLGQTELKAKLNPNRADVREVAQRCEVFELEPLDSDLRAYLAFKLKLVNKKLEDLMEANVVDALRERMVVAKSDNRGKETRTSMVYPLAINNMITALLNQAAELGQPKLTNVLVMEF